MKISVITVCYNSVETIADTLNSVAIQTYQNVEHIIVDGGSTDGTLALARAEGRPGRVVISEDDDGIYDAMNKGLALASGEIIGFLNSDDAYFDATTLESIAAGFRDATVDACYGDLVYVDKAAQQIRRFWKSRPFVKGDFAKGWSPAHPTFYISKRVLERLGGFDTSYRLAADAELMMRYLECGSVQASYIPQVLVRMRLGGATNQSWRNIIRQNQEIFAALRKHGLSYSVGVYWMNKFINRFGQLIGGRLSR